MAAFKTYWLTLRRRWLIVVALAVAGALAGFGFSKLQEPVFRSSAKLYVMPTRPDYGNILFIQNVVRQYGQLIVADRFLKSVSESQKLDLPVEEMRRRVTASGNVENLVIFIDVDDTDAGRARSIARQLTQDFIRDQDGRMKNVDPANRIDVRAYDDPTPAVLSRPQTRVNTMAAGFLSLLVGVALAFVLDALDDTVKSAEEVDRLMGVRVFGAIPSTL
jgi:capsular polysaccharide biosynthesis protein